MGIEDYLNLDTWKFIEWPQKIEKLLDEDVQKLEVLIKDDGIRMLKFC
jgi:tRNA threonylcarbamoyladenosine biosynthesis protein TsaE